jgi:hypothetical protein
LTSFGSGAGVGLGADLDIGTNNPGL